jgi:hypothetical protein
MATRPPTKQGEDEMGTRQVFVTHHPDGDVSIEVHNNFGKGDGWPDKVVTFKGHEIKGLVALMTAEQTTV